MAPPQKHATPVAQLRRLAVEARAQGLDFDSWWVHATRPNGPHVLTNSRNPPEGVVLWPSDRNERLAWREAVEESRDGWRRAYEGLPATPEEHAVIELLSSLAEAAGGQMLAAAA